MTRYIDEILEYIKEQFVNGKVSTAKKLVYDCVIVTQNRHCITILDKAAYGKFAGRCLVNFLLELNVETQWSVLLQCPYSSYPTLLHVCRPSLPLPPLPLLSSLSLPNLPFLPSSPLHLPPLSLPPSNHQSLINVF